MAGRGQKQQEELPGFNFCQILVELLRSAHISELFVVSHFGEASPSRRPP